MRAASATVLRVTGRVSSVSGALIMFATLCSCLYWYAVGSAPDLSSTRDQSTVGYQSGKVGLKTMTTKLRHPALKVSGYEWNPNENRLDAKASQKKTNVRPCMPSGDVTADPDTELLNDKRNKAVHYSSNVNPSILKSNFLRMPNHRRHHSMDTQITTGSLLPVLKDSILGAGTMNSKPLWMPNLHDTGSSSFQQGGSLSSALYGQEIEPLGAMLHRGGHVKLGGPYV